MTAFKGVDQAVEEADWIAGLPRGWEYVRLKITASSAKNGVWGDNPDGGSNDIACARVADFDRQRFLVNLDDPTFRSVSQSQKNGRILRKGDLLLEKSGGGDKQPVGAVVMYTHEQPAVCSNFVARLEVAAGHHSRFLTYLHASLYGQRVNTRSIKQTTGIQNLDGRMYLNEVVALPPLPTQRAIADFLDRKTAAIDALIEKKERLLELLAEKRAALIHQAVTKGLDPNVPMKDSGVPWIGEVPAHWKLARLGYLSKEVSDGLHGTPTYDDEGDYHFINGTNLSSGRIHFDDSTRRVSQEEWRRRDVGLDPTTVLLSINGTVGHVALYNGEQVMLGKSAAYVKCDTSRLRREFLAFFLRSPIATIYYALESPGTTVNNLSLKSIRQMPLPLPPQDAQDASVAWLHAATKRIDEQSSGVELSARLLQEYRQALITAAVTGQLNVEAEAGRPLPDPGGQLPIFEEAR